MSPDELAQRFERRKDFDLVDVALVALPMYLLTLECVCSVHREFPPIALFLLRAVRAGLTDEKEIAAFLGLDPSVTRVVTRQMLDGGYIVKGGDEETISLSAQGEKIIEQEKEFVPQEEVHIVIFDGLIRKPVWLSGEQLLRPSEIDRSNTIEIRPYPGALPEIEDLNLADVTEVLRKQHGGAKEFGRDFLALSRVARRSRVFRSGVGLAYRARRGPDTQFAFVIDGVPDAKLEQVFAEKGGPRKMGFIKALSQVGVDRGLKRHLGEGVVALLPDSAQLSLKRQLLAGARLGLDIAAKRAESEPSEEVRGKFAEARQRFEECDRELRMFPARPLAVYEVGMLLDDALRTASDRVFLAVGEFWKSRPGRDAISKLEKALKKGVRIHVFELVKEKQDGDRNRPPASNDLDKLGRRYPNLRMLQTKRRGFFFLIKDRQFAAIGNRPFLGPATRARMFHEFAGYLLQSRELVDAYSARLQEGVDSDG